MNIHLAMNGLTTTQPLHVLIRYPTNNWTYHDLTLKISGEILPVKVQILY